VDFWLSDADEKDDEDVVAKAKAVESVADAEYVTAEAPTLVSDVIPRLEAKSLCVL
jgi:hypothetical protein